MAKNDCKFDRVRTLIDFCNEHKVFDKFLNKKGEPKNMTLEVLYAYYGAVTGAWIGRVELDDNEKEEFWENVFKKD